MKRAFLIAAAVATAAAATAFGGTEVEPTASADVIEIEVPAHKLAECQETLAQVANMPVVTDTGTPVLFPADQSLPSVRCVVAPEA